jgi:hypothetical protein
MDVCLHETIDPVREAGTGRRRLDGELTEHVDTWVRSWSALR